MSDISSEIVDLLDTWGKLKEDMVRNIGISPEFWSVINGNDSIPVAAVFFNGKETSLSQEDRLLIEEAIKKAVPHLFED
tara:strand:+ start:315 stop:551 length:237 start_codon:yes stop_codon:yes gene_type:complete